MALSDDQKAILRLLAQRGAQGYEDLAALMGISVDEVHARAKQAAADLEAEGIPAPSIPVPAAEGESPSPKSSEEAPPKKKVVSEPVKPMPHHEHGHSPRELAHEAKLLKNRGLWAILAGVAIIVLFLVILFVSGGDDGSDSSSTTTSASASNCEKPTGTAPEPNGKIIAALASGAIKAGKEPTRAVLDPVDGSEARGLAVFGRVKNSLALQLAVEGLSPLPKCGGYTVWLAASPDKMLPLASTEVSKNGQIRAQVEVPVEILAYLANETFGQIAVTATDESQLRASLAQATKEKEAPQYTGTEVLRGTVDGPIVGVAKRLEKEEGE